MTDDLSIEQDWLECVLFGCRLANLEWIISNWNCLREEDEDSSLLLNSEQFLIKHIFVFNNFNPIFCFNKFRECWLERKKQKIIIKKLTVAVNWSDRKRDFANTLDSFFVIIFNKFAIKICFNFSKSCWRRQTRVIFLKKKKHFSIFSVKLFFTETFSPLSCCVVGVVVVSLSWTTTTTNVSPSPTSDVVATNWPEVFLIV